MGSFKLTVRDVLKNKCFEDATIIAGHGGLDKVVRWVHIMEVTEIGKLLNGSELILSTGVGWKNNKKTSVEYLKQLIHAGASGLCLELVKYTNEISKEMIELANQHNLPVIVFQKEVRFIDITQHLNSSLMNNQYKILSDLEEFSRKLNHTLLLPNAFQRVLHLLQETLNVQVLYISKNKEEKILIPMQNEKEKQRLLKIVEGHQNDQILNQNKQYHSPNGTYAGQPIQALGHNFADLYIFPLGDMVSEYEALVLDRCATAVSQDLLRIFYIEEQRRHREQQWVYQWLKGDFKDKEIREYIAMLDPVLKPKGAVVSVCQVNELTDNSTYSYYMAIFRTIFQHHGFFLISVFERKQLVFILINQRGKDWKKRASNAFQRIYQVEMFQALSKETPYFGVGKYVENLEKLSESYLAAKESLQIQKNARIKNQIFYEDLHVYRIVSMMNKHGDLSDYINEYIGSVIQYDEKHKSEMLFTLNVFLESSGSKKDAAKRLFVVRQTLYHRLDRLKELLGEDFMEPAKRAAIEFALHAYRYVNPSAFAYESVIEPLTEDVY